MALQSVIGDMLVLTTGCVAGALALAIYVVAIPIAGCLLGLRNGRGTSLGRGDLETRFLVLVPAHNEAEHLRPTLRSLMRVDYPPKLFDVTVIADNCTDNTAEIAFQEGCDVWERSDILRRGKGHALAWALARPSIASFDAVVIIDADTQVSFNLLEAFAWEIQSERIPLQARVNFEFPPDTPDWLSLTSTATQRAEEKYVSATRSQMRLYQGLQGTGFCIPVCTLQVVPWSAHSTCEDLEYGFQLAAKGIAIRFVQDASVASSMTGRLKHASEQRERWARGTYALIAKLLPLQIFNAIRRADWRCFEAAFYLLTRSRLPLALLTATSGICLLIVRHYAPRTLWIALGIALILESSYVIAILSTLRPQYSRKQLLLGFFRYSTWLVTRHLGALLTLRNTRWIRTERG
jgi:cellulose synthase/poly-beta-1,6-N-acetylglucosamine synthase-like glycosyltransferase